MSEDEEEPQPVFYVHKGRLMSDPKTEETKTDKKDLSAKVRKTNDTISLHKAIDFLFIFFYLFSIYVLISYFDLFCFVFPFHPFRYSFGHNRCSAAISGQHC